ncbi:hypothetical protein [Nostoc sp.]
MSQSLNSEAIFVVLVDFADAVAEELSLPFDHIFLESERHRN